MKSRNNNATTMLRRAEAMKTFINFVSIPVVGAIVAFLLFTLATMEVNSQDVKYCKNYETGEIIVVEINMPCPFPTSEM